jgi:hypothetical protein
MVVFEAEADDSSAATVILFSKRKYGNRRAQIRMMDVLRRRKTLFIFIV